MAMRKLLIFISLIFIYSPLFSQVNIYQIKHTRAKVNESMLQRLPESIRENLQMLNPTINNLRGLERANIDERIPLDFFTNMTVGDSGLMITYASHDWDSLAQDWSIDPILRRQFTYDSNGNLIEFVWQDWRDGPDLLNSWRHLYTYDLNGNQTEELRQGWDGADWVINGRYLYTYDLNGNLTEELGQGWDGADWVINGRYLYTYDLNGNLTEYLWQAWDGTNWWNGNRSLYTYDSNGNRTEYIEHYWDGTDLVYEHRELYTYDLNGNLTEELRQGWVDIDWVNSSRHLYTYDLNGNLTEELGQGWDGADWVINGRYLYTYDLNGNQTEELYQNWDVNDWVNDWRYLYTYDLNGNQTEDLWQVWDVNDWVNSGIVYVDYTNIAISVESEITGLPTEFALSQNYPNPFNPETMIEYTLPFQSEVNLIIYNLRGEEVAHLINDNMLAGNHQVTWNASNFASGIYFYRLQAGDFVQTRKMVLLK